MQIFVFTLNKNIEVQANINLLHFKNTIDVQADL